MLRAAYFMCGSCAGKVAMEIVTRFESDLLKVLYYFLGREPLEVALPRLRQQCAAPPCLHRGALRLVQDALALGCTWQLAHRGGWRSERFQRGDGVAAGRLWQRTPPGELGLSFSARSLEFLLWVTANIPGDATTSWRVAEDQLALGDWMLLYFAHERLRGTPDDLGIAAWRLRQPMAQHPLARLAYPDDFTDANPSADPSPKQRGEKVASLPGKQARELGSRINFLPWTTGAGAAILEALQHELAERWIVVESTKARIGEPARMHALGAVQEAVLISYFDALEQAGRWDLARFLLQVAATLFSPDAVAEMWVGGLQTAALSLAERTAVYRDALVFVRVLDRLHRWTRLAQSIGYFDDGYQAAQRWKGDWEQYQGDALVGRAHAIARQLDPLNAAPD